MKMRGVRPHKMTVSHVIMFLVGLGRHPATLNYLLVMKNFIIILAIIAGFICSNVMSAQDAKTIEKQRQEQVKKTRKNLNQKPCKDAKKQAKELKKEGWKVYAGAPILEKQLDRSMMYEAETDNEGNPAWIMASDKSIAENYSPAHIQAIELAKIALLQTLENDMTLAIKTGGGSSQLSANESASAIKTTIAAMSLVKQKLVGVRPVVDIYRTLPNGNTEVQVTICYSRRELWNASRQIIRDELMKESEDLAKKADCILNGYCPIE